MWDILKRFKISLYGFTMIIVVHRSLDKHMQLLQVILLCFIYVKYCTLGKLKYWSIFIICYFYSVSEVNTLCYSVTSSDSITLRKTKNPSNKHGISVCGRKVEYPEETHTSTYDLSQHCTTMTPTVGTRTWYIKTLSECGFISAFLHLQPEISFGPHLFLWTHVWDLHWTPGPGTPSAHVSTVFRRTWIFLFLLSFYVFSFIPILRYWHTPKWTHESLFSQLLLSPGNTSSGTARTLPFPASRTNPNQKQARVLFPRAPRGNTICCQGRLEVVPGAPPVETQL